MIRRIVIGLVVLFVAIQLVPYGRDHTNPPVTKEPAWDSPDTQRLAERACFDCHSNETRWPWYTSVAPFSWLAQSDVDDGRRHLNFSEWDRFQKHADDAAEEVEEGEMPLWYYLPLHSDARLTDTERDTLVAGLKRSFPKKEDDEGAAIRTPPPAP